MAGRIQNIEEGSEVNLRPSIIVRLNDTHTLCKRKRGSEEEKGSHDVGANELSEESEWTATMAKRIKV
jgi:hypothetical protein